MSKVILVVEDEASIVTLLKYNLEQAGFQVLTSHDGKEGLEIAIEKNPDLILLDIMLPTIDGIEVCKEIRSQKKNIPIIMITARDDEFDTVLGLELGADDYITKPFSPREVIARVKAVLRRIVSVDSDSEKIESNFLKIGSLVVYPDRFEAFLNDEPLELTSKEFELLLYLLENKNRVLTRDQLLNAVWGYDYVKDSRIVDVKISHLREKIENNSRQPKYIKTIRGIGYKFEEPKKCEN